MNRLIRRTTLVMSILALLISAVPVLYLEEHVSAAPGLNNRSLSLETPVVSATGTYTFQFDIISAANLGSIQFEFCSNNPLPFEPCTAPAGFDISGAVFGAGDQTGETGFSIDGGSTTANDLLIVRGAAAPATPQTVSYAFNPTINPSAIGSYYVRVYTFSSTDGSGTAVEEAGFAFAIEDGLSVTAFVPPFLEFCVAITIPNANCVTATGSFADFGEFSDSNTRTATSQLATATNGVGGVGVSVLGTTMTSGVNTIPGLATRTTANTGTSQFGMNLRNNSSPNVGVDSIGVGTIVPTTDYNVPNQFTFRSGDTVAVSSLSTDFNRLTASYIVNVDSNQAPGVYTTTLTYVATATF